jgi:hypothetical protein
MSSIALGVWVAFLKQPDDMQSLAERPSKNKKYIF